MCNIVDMIHFSHPVVVVVVVFHLQAIYAVFIMSAMFYLLFTWTNIHISATIITAFWPAQVSEMAYFVPLVCFSLARQFVGGHLSRTVTLLQASCFGPFSDNVESLFSVHLCVARLCR